MNRLGDQTSPYLRQHADNPVFWQPWSADALAEAKTLDRPILLSIGYAACHWCHVMAHESFEDDATARIASAEAPDPVALQHRVDTPPRHLGLDFTPGGLPEAGAMELGSGVPGRLAGERARADHGRHPERSEYPP